MEFPKYTVWKSRPSIMVAAGISSGEYSCSKMWNIKFKLEIDNQMLLKHNIFTVIIECVYFNISFIINLLNLTFHILD